MQSHAYNILLKADGYSMTNGNANTFTHNLKRIKSDMFAFNLISTGMDNATMPQCGNTSYTHYHCYSTHKYLETHHSYTHVGNKGYADESATVDYPIMFVVVGWITRAQPFPQSACHSRCVYSLFDKCKFFTPKKTTFITICLHCTNDMTVRD